MKKIICLLLIIGACLGLQFCDNENNESLECKTCKTTDFDIVNTDFVGESYQLKRYSGNNYTFMYQNTKDFIPYLEFLSNKKISIDVHSIVTLTIFTDNDIYSDSEDYTVEDDDIEGILVYEKIDGIIRSRIFYRQNNNFVENATISNLKTNYVSSNDFSQFLSSCLGTYQ
jgi:hypothetical protein